MESNEEVRCVLQGQCGGVTGPEKESKISSDVSVFSDPYGSYRFVKYVGDQPVAGIQVMSRDRKQGFVTKAYTLPEYRLQGYATELVKYAKKKFGHLVYSEDRSKEGGEFVDSLSRTSRLALQLVRRYAAENPIDPNSFEGLVNRLREENPGLTLNAYENPYQVHIQDIEAKPTGQGTGTKVMRRLQEYARQVGKPIVLHPEPERGKKAALMRFYKSLGFVMNKGRKRDYALSSPFGPTMYWKP